STARPSMESAAETLVFASRAFLRKRVIELARYLFLHLGDDGLGLVVGIDQPFLDHGLADALQLFLQLAFRPAQDRAVVDKGLLGLGDELLALDPQPFLNLRG